MRIAVVIALTLASAATAHAACPTDLEAASIAARVVNLQPIPNPPAELSMADALCARDRINRYLEQQFGPVVGYKAGLTNPAVQKRFNYDKPVRGTLFAKMLLKDGAELPARFGARPLFEADLLVEVKDAGIMKATTPLAVLRHLSRIYPFIELPDLHVEDPAKITGPALQMVNVGARAGVLGAPLEVRPDAALVDALAAMTVKLVDGDGKTFDEGKGAAILDQPLNAVIWLAKDLAASGITLKRGDLLSLGSFSRLHPPKPGMTVRAVYEGLPGNPAVTVRFR